jgi:stage II sporulation protein D
MLGHRMTTFVRQGFPQPHRRNLPAQPPRSGRARQEPRAFARRACAALAAAALVLAARIPAEAQIMMRVGLYGGAPVSECAISGWAASGPAELSDDAATVRLSRFVHGNDNDHRWRRDRHEPRPEEFRVPAASSADTRNSIISQRDEIGICGMEPVRITAAGNEVILTGGMGPPWRGERLVAEARGGLVALARGATAPRAYRGSIEITASGGSLRLVNVIDVEDYVRSVVAAEMSPSFHPQALMAQAILARTYALRAVGRHAKAGFDLCDTNHCQVYAGAIAETPQTTAAVEATRDLVLTLGSEIADVNYHSTCGGHTAAAWEVWPGAKHLPHLAGGSDEVDGVAACAGSPQFYWTAQISTADLARISGASGQPGLPTRLTVTRRSADGRAAQIEISFGARTVAVTGQDFYLRCAATLGWGVVKSAWFEVTPASAGWRLTGRGAGHGVGLCQWGAQGRAQAGASAREILAAYFPGAQVRRVDESGAAVARLADH